MNILKDYVDTIGTRAFGEGEEMTYDKVYFYYDQPMHYISRIGERLFHVVAISDNEDSTRFLYAETPKNVIEQMEQNVITVREAFENADNWWIVNESANGSVSVDEVRFSDIDEDDLPEGGHYLNDYVQHS